MIHVGFTGTQKGLSGGQEDTLFDLLTNLQRGHLTYWFHHGDCIGADQRAHELAVARGYAIFLHPPNIAKKRAFCSGIDDQAVEKPYIVRNHDIVDSTDVLIACPKDVEIVRSGTWATVRYARLRHKNIFIIYPSGVAEMECPP